MADTALLLGLAGVGGTIIGTGLGATIAARSTFAVERRREQRAERGEAAALRAAARLVWLDFAQCDASLAWAGARRRWSAGEVPLPMEAWDEHRDRLALGISEPSAWETVANAVAALARLRLAMGAHRPTELSQGLVESVQEAHALVLIAAAVLAPIAEVPGLRPAPETA